MASIFWNGFGIADETTLTTSLTGTGGDTACVVIDGSNLTVDTTTMLHTAGIRIDQQAGVTARAGWQLAASGTQASGRIYFQTPASWAATQQALVVITPNPVASTNMRIFMSGSSTPGQLRLQDSTATQVANSPASTISNSTWYRIEWRLVQNAGTPTSGQAQVVLYVGDGTTALWDSGTVTSNFGTSLQRIYIGSYFISPQMPTYWLSNLYISDSGATLPGPYIAGTPTVTVWNGTAEVAAAATVWNGTSEVAVGSVAVS